MNADLGPVETEPDTIFVKVAADATKWVSTGHPVSQCRVDFFWTLHCRQVPAVFHQNQFGTGISPAVSTLRSGGVSTSSRPQTTSVGRSIADKPGRLSARRMMAFADAKKHLYLHCPP